LVLVVLALVGLLTYQSVHTLLIIRRGQSQQARIAQVRELLDLAKQFEKSSNQKESIRPGQFSIILPVGDEYGKLELLPANVPEKEDQERSGQNSVWIAKLPVDSQGNEIAGRSPVVASLERLSRK
jgi:hypothetical protein